MQARRLPWHGLDGLPPSHRARMPRKSPCAPSRPFAEKTTYSRGFEKFIERVNAEGKGIIQINYIGGPKAMPPFEVGNALKSGVDRHRQHHRRLLHQRDAGGATPGS